MVVKQSKFAAALTILEVLVATLVLGVAAVGVLSHQYHAAIHARIACAQITSMRTSQLLLEDWKSTGGSEEYDVSTLGLGFSSGSQIPGGWDAEDDELGSAVNDSLISAVVDGLPMLITLRWYDVAQDATAEIKLRQLTIITRFGEIDGSGDVTYSESYLCNFAPVIMSTYVRVDESSG